ncbi:MAG TPA: DUF3592 domain-containing protein [Planctomycetota bacterium]|nr:DUF3592 domain-containing protein [Planctomycetota bacterium]
MTVELSPAPRALPMLLRAQLLSGGFMNQFGWFFFGFGMIFARVFAGNADVGAVRFWFADEKIVEGTVTAVEETGASEGGSDNSPGTPIYRIKYRYAPPEDGKVREGVSYKLGFSSSTGSTVRVEYLPGNPAVSRIEGCRGAMFSMWALFVLIFPLVGAVFVYFGIRKGIRANHLLGHGKLAWGKLKSEEPTGARINNRVVMKLTFEFKAEDGSSNEVVAKTHEPERLKDEEQEAVLYDPEAPSYAVLKDSLPGSPEITPEGHLRAGRPAKGLVVLILPLLTLVGHAIPSLL